MDCTYMEKALTPSNVVQLGIKFKVPIYQRLFVWEQQQIEKLLHDLMNAWKEVADKPDADKPYYIGIITVNENNDNIWEVVDGQQRLTFLTLFGALCLQHNYATSSAKWREFLFSDNDTLRISYFGREADSNDVRNMIQMSSGDKSIQNINFRCFIDCFERLELNPGEWDKYAQYVFEHTSFFVSHLPNQYKPRQLNLFFEKMNSAGRQLSPIDLLKVQFGSSAPVWNACMDFDTKYTNPDSMTCEPLEQVSINTILENAANVKIVPEPPRENHHIGNQLIIKPEVFLLHVLRLSTGNTNIPLNGDQLIDTFKNNFKNNQEGSFIDVMKKYRTWLDENIIYLLAEENSGYTYAFRREKEPKADSESGELLEEPLLSMRQFQSMLYVSSSESQEWLLDAYGKCKKESIPLTLDLLRKQDWERNPLPKSEEPSMSYPAIRTYWFWKLDYLLWERCINSDETMELPDEKMKKLVREYVFRRSNRSREHLQPQANSFDTKIENSFGNLALIAPGTNSSLSDNPINTKFGRVLDILNGNGRLESIKMLYMFNLARTENGLKWDEQKVKQHKSIMYDILETDMKRFIP